MVGLSAVGVVANGVVPGALPASFHDLVADLYGLVPPQIRTLIAIVAVLVVGWYGSRLLVNLSGRTIARRIDRPSITRMVLRGIRAMVMVAAVLYAAALGGVETGDILISVTVLTAVVGVILAPLAGSFINGLFVLADRPFEIGDMIEFVDTGRRGFVDDITIRYTKMFTLDNTFIVVSNSEIRQRDVINYSAEDERMRLSLSLLVTYEGDLGHAREIMEEAAGDVDEVISGGPAIRIGAARYPAAPTAYVDEYADHGVLLTLRYWAKQPYKLLTVRSKVNEGVWSQLADADDVEVAYPHQHLVFDNTSGTAKVAMEEAAGERPRKHNHSAKPADEERPER